MLLGSFAFAVMGVLAKDLTEHGCDWQVAACARAGLVCVFALGLSLLGRVRLVVVGSRMLWMRSVAGSLSMVCTFYAFGQLHVAEVMTLTNTFPIWVAFLSWPLLGRFPKGPVWVAVLCAVAGLFLMAPAASSEAQPRGSLREAAMLLGLLAALFTSFAMLGLHHLGGLDSRAVVVHFSAVACAFCLASFFVFPRKHDLAECLQPYLALLLLGVGVSATLGQLCLTWAFTTGVPTKVSVVALTQIVFALLFEGVPTGLALVGIALVVGPSAWLMLHRTE
jgi:drug/metabolite transporter (DMT)-like permease